MNKKQWVKIALMSAPIIALVIATLAGLDATAQQSINDVIVQIVVIVAGALGVTGVVANNDKDEQ
ncbi:hypothetical protein HV436_01355 [Bacillus sporothermodurans]|uniref:hypothetical protein n=1 Tax=Heyndrickxia sporothermodurans TaxID=46224 RepID=UPI00192CD09C|nr:hypothetical protein [Heyndrickxia sporothermodurans]MBL5776983.1 hypothetical protein [Heyndrickxia sporothermodurans]MBL5798510.1 hypothetical protein [Heyndrickxia sporothermodurans]MBL5809427.1 hypothetical protein [Heyndrickxia sporothermodurans]MBL5813062.1 hypothetical protein [Heyndrickxia sporothermodurans]MBL5816486.1 hypothetical protein [Heyndrickxia sporothermodurans]